MMILYNILFLSGIILGFPLLLPLVLLPVRRRKTFLQRSGVIRPPGRDRTALPPETKRIWIHALSLGEVISAVPLVKAVREDMRDAEIVFSASTKTGFETAEKELGKTVSLLFFFPYDLLFSVKRIVSRIDPDMIVIVETDIWPNFLNEAKKRGIPVLLLNTRLSQKSFAAYRKFSFFTRTLFQTFSAICPQSQADARRFIQLGVRPERIYETGNMKFDQTPDEDADIHIRELQKKFRIPAERNIWIAGSTHEGEEDIISEVFSRLKLQFPDLFLILAPRNPDRADTVCRIFSEKGFAAVKMAEIEKNPSQTCEVMLTDRIGVLKYLYALSDIAFVGGSLVAQGGHNPLEPAAYGKPVLFGPHTGDFAEISDMLVQAGAAVRVADEESLYNSVLDFLKDKEKARKAGRQGLRVFSENKGATARSLTVIRSLL